MNFVSLPKIDVYGIERLDIYSPLSWHIYAVVFKENSGITKQHISVYFQTLCIVPLSSSL